MERTNCVKQLKHHRGLFLTHTKEKAGISNWEAAPSRDSDTQTPVAYFPCLPSCIKLVWGEEHEGAHGEDFVGQANITTARATENCSHMCAQKTISPTVLRV